MKPKSNSAIVSAGLFVLLCLIWGSSFVLMKIGMYGVSGAQQQLTPWQLAACRMLSASFVMLPVALHYRRQWMGIHNKWLVVATGLIGTFIPSILFCLAETGISSALAGTLNATTPLFAMLIGIVFFQQRSVTAQWLGIGIGLAGCILLFAHKGITPPDGLGYAALILLATICYGFNTNIAKAKFSGLPVLQFSAFALSSLVIPALILAVVSGLHTVSLRQNGMSMAILAGVVLGVVGTGIATVLFYGLVKKSGVVLASMVTYGIPFVALGWGLVYGESVGTMQVAALVVILAGVFIAGKRKN